MMVGDSVTFALNSSITSNCCSIFPCITHKTIQCHVMCVQVPNCKCSLTPCTAPKTTGKKAKTTIVNEWICIDVCVCCECILHVLLRLFGVFEVHPKATNFIQMRKNRKVLIKKLKHTKSRGCVLGSEKRGWKKTHTAIRPTQTMPFTLPSKSIQIVVVQFAQFLWLKTGTRANKKCQWPNNNNYRESFEN